MAAIDLGRLACNPVDGCRKLQSPASRTTGRTRSEERLRAAAALGWVRSVPDECFWSDVEIARPDDRPMPGADAAEERVVGAQAIEHRAPQQVLDVPLHNGTVRQGEAEPPTLKWLGRSNAKQHHGMLSQRCDAIQSARRPRPLRGRLCRRFSALVPTGCSCSCLTASNPATSTSRATTAWPSSG